jgi:hypothetical protein
VPSPKFFPLQHPSAPASISTSLNASSFTHTHHHPLSPRLWHTNAEVSEGGQEGGTMWAGGEVKAMSKYFLVANKLPTSSQQPTKVDNGNVTQTSYDSTAQITAPAYHQQHVASAVDGPSTPRTPRGLVSMQQQAHQSYRQQEQYPSNVTCSGGYWEGPEEGRGDMRMASAVDGPSTPRTSRSLVSMQQQAHQSYRQQEQYPSNVTCSGGHWEGPEEGRGDMRMAVLEAQTAPRTPLMLATNSLHSISSRRQGMVTSPPGRCVLPLYITSCLHTWCIFVSSYAPFLEAHLYAIECERRGERANTMTS